MRDIINYFNQSSAIAVLSVLLLLQPLPVLSAKKIELNQDLNEIKEKIESLKKELDNSEEAHKDAADALKDSERAISEANKKLFEINQRQKENKKTLVKLDADSKDTNQSLAEQQKLLSTQLYRQYIHGQQSYVQMILQSEHPSGVSRDVHYYTYIAKARADLIHNMQSNLAKMTKLNQETAAALQEVAELKQKQIDERQTLEAQQREKSKIVKSLSTQIVVQRGEIKKLTRDEKRLSQLVERLAKITPPKPKKQSKPILMPNPSGEEKPSRTIVANNQALPSEEVSGINFSSLKGKLRLPVRGDVTNRFGASREESGIAWKGLFIKANEGAEVKSVASGRVVFADWLRGFGNLLIVDHGDGYMSLYGNNQATLKQAGEEVHAGETIAAVGNSGGNPSNGLYYELRRQSKPFDPLSWSNLN